ncbi:carboxynorspermidine decarboxylase [Candidatus Peregrinibacteria bacterium]|nr:carboxynorspermidine decarboxylase [Candidatus Peregrinibacteria bacterium]
MSIRFENIPSPCYVIDESLLKRNILLIDDVQKRSGAKIILALKGFAMWKTFPYFQPYFQGTTASSLHEARLGHEEFGGEVHGYCPAYQESEFSKMMQYCNHVTFNSLTEWGKFRGAIRSSEKKISCGLRINPEHNEVSCDLYNPSVPGSRLGIPVEKLGDRLPDGIEGLHFHNLCEGDSFALERTLAVIEEKFGAYLKQIRWLNMGGGHLMTRKGYDIEHLIRLLRAVAEKYGISVILEPGAAFVWETGYLVSTVLDIVEHKGISVLMLDTSVSAHMPDCLEMPYKPKILGASDAVEGLGTSEKLATDCNFHALAPNASSVLTVSSSDTVSSRGQRFRSKRENFVTKSSFSEVPLPRYRIGGLTCMAGDYVGDYSFEKEPRVGDRVIFNDMIHYTFVKNNTFNGVNLPSLGMWREDDRFELFRKFGYEDYKGRLS